MVEEAEVVADEVGLDRLSLVTIAERLGVRVPSLYKHIDSLDSLRPLLAVRAKNELADVLGSATVGKSGDEAVTALAWAYRDWALAHPGRYTSTLRAPSANDAQDVTISAVLVRLVYDVLGAYHLTDDDAVDATRSLRAALHGFVSLEMSHGFGLPANVDRSFGRLVSALRMALADWPTVESRSTDRPGRRTVPPTSRSA